MLLHELMKAAQREKGRERMVFILGSSPDVAVKAWESVRRIGSTAWVL